MVSLPTPGASKNNWGDQINDFLRVSHNEDGSLKEESISGAGYPSAEDAATTAITVTQLTPANEGEEVVKGPSGNLFSVISRVNAGAYSTLAAAIEEGVGRTVFIPRDDYQISSPLAVTTDRTAIEIQQGATFEQTAYAKPVFDVYDADDVIIEGNGALLQYLGSRTYVSQPSFRGSNGTSYGAGVWSNGNRTRVRGIRGYGFRSAVFFSGFDTTAGAQVDYAHIDNEAHGIIVDTCDFGVLAAGQDRTVVRDIRGKYTLSPTSPDPSHLIYFSSSAWSRDIDVNGLIAQDSTGGEAFKFDSVRGGRAVNMTAHNCEGLLYTDDVYDMEFQARGIGDIQTNINNNSVMTHDRMERCTFDVEISGAAANTGHFTVRLDGYRNRFRVKIWDQFTTTDNAKSPITLRGLANTLDAWVANLDPAKATPAGGWLAVLVSSTGGGGHKVNLHEARNMARGVQVESGAARCEVAVNSAGAVPSSGASTTFNLISDSTTVLNRNGVQTFTVSAGTQTRPDTSLYAAARIIQSDSTNFVLGSLLGTPPQGAEFIIIIDNQSGGAGPGITWNGITLNTTDFGAWVNPASGATKMVKIVRDGTTWKEISRSA